MLSSDPNVIPPYIKLDPLWPVSAVVACCRILALAKPKITRKLGKVTLDTCQEHFEISDNLLTVHYIFQDI